MGEQDDRKKTPDEVLVLVPLALTAIAELLSTTDEKLPAGVEGVLRNFGASCYQEGIDVAHEAWTMPAPDPEEIDTLEPPGNTGDTNPSFPPPLESLLPPPGVPSIFSKPTRPPPGGKKQKTRLPLPPRLPRGLVRDDEEK